MSTKGRDRAIHLAKERTPKAMGKALAQARAISAPWFRAQALSYVARFADEDPITLVKEALKTAAACDDDYKRIAVCAWPLRALVERDKIKEAKAEVARLASGLQAVEPPSSRSEAALLLFQAAFSLGPTIREQFARQLLSVYSEHWRAKRNLEDCLSMLVGSDPALADQFMNRIEDRKGRIKAERAMATPRDPREFFH